MPKGINKSILTVSEINECVKLILENDELLTRIYVRGEISNLSERGGHLYFTLKDSECAVSAIMFRYDAGSLKFKPSNAMNVIVGGRIGVYKASGKYQIICNTMEPDGVGALFMAYEQLKKKLSDEGLFDRERKKPIPPYPERIGVITSPVGAAVRDIINIISRRYPIAGITVYPALVQGAGAAADLIAGIDYFNTVSRADVIIIGRGGGSAEDLWEFNNEALCRRVAGSSVPVISGVGHETDYTLCDFAADLRAPTPSGAAELSVPDCGTIYASLLGSEERLNSLIMSLTEKLRGRVNELSSSRVLTDGNYMISEKIQRTDSLARLMLSSYEKILQRKKAELYSVTSGKALMRGIESVIKNGDSGVRTLAHRLDSLSPLSVLGRGYAGISTKDGTAIKSVGEIQTGDDVSLTLADGTLTARVKDIKENKHNG